MEVGSSLRTLAWGLLLEQPQGACVSLHPPCSERGVRINKTQFRKEMQIVILSKPEKMWVSHERKKLTNKINAGYLCSYSLETTLVYQFCCLCSRAGHAAKQG